MTSTVTPAVQVPADASVLTAPAAAALGQRRFQPLPPRVQFSYTTRFVSTAVAQDATAFALVAGEAIEPQPGDVVIARVTTIANHKRVECENSRKATLYPGAYIALAYGHRYAADQFLAHVPNNLDHCHLVAAGGIAGLVTKMHDKITGATEIEPIGLLTYNNTVVNLADCAPLHNIPLSSAPLDRPEVFAVLGTSMNSGKSTVMSCLVNGLMKAGLKVGAGKITGTGAGNDRMHYYDAGANEVLDFTDYGYGSTFHHDSASLRSLTVNMVDQLGRDNDVVVVEIADGVYQKETNQLLRDDLFQQSVDQVVFAAVDALGAVAGVREIDDAGLAVACVSGVLTSSPLATREARAVLGRQRIEVVGTFDLMDPDRAQALRQRS